VKLFVLGLVLAGIAQYAPAQLSTADITPDFPYGSSNWQAGRIPGMVIDPSNDSILYAAAEWTGVWKSTDGAHTWHQTASSLRNGITAEFAYPNLAIDDQNSQRLLYATTSKDGRGFACEGCSFGGLWVTTNGASNWQHVSLCAVNFQADNIASVIFSSGRPFVVTDCGIWTTTDAKLLSGWTTLTLPNGASPGGTLMAPGSYGQTLFACLGGGTRLYRSLDLGKTWDSGVDVGGRCTGLAVAPIPERFQPGTTVVIHSLGPRPTCPSPQGANGLEVTVVDSDLRTTIDLCFNTVATNGSGRSGVWVGPHASTYDVFAADNLNFYHYTGNHQWSGGFPVHADTWWMVFPSSYDGASSCGAFAANDGGVWVNPSGSCSFTADAAHGGWVTASSGLHVLFSTGISGLSVKFPNQLFCLDNQGDSCSLLLVGSADDDTFIRDPSTDSWTNFPDGLGDSDRVMLDPAQPNLGLAIRNSTYHLFVAPVGQTVSGSSNNYSIIGNGYATRLQDPADEDVKQVLTLPTENPLVNGDFLALYGGDSTKDIIQRNVSVALGGSTAQSSWFDISPEAHFGPGQVGGIYPSGGHGLTTVYVLTSNAPGVSYNSTPYQPGQVYKAVSQIFGEAITSWQPASGSGPNALVRAYSLFVNPYDPNELWATDLGGTPAIKVSRDGGQSWRPVPQLKDIATNYGEFDFDCGQFTRGYVYSNYNDKDIFGNQCPITGMFFPLETPSVRVAVLYPGGVAFSRDGGNNWIPLNVTNAQPSQQPIELPHSAFYNPAVNASGNSSLYIALEGKGVKRVDGPFATLGSLILTVCVPCVDPNLAGLLNPSVSVVSNGQLIPLTLGADGYYHGNLLFDTAKVSTISYHFTINGQSTPDVSYALSSQDKSTGVITVNDSLAISSVVNGAGFQPSIAPGSWATIIGSNLTKNTRTWRADEIVSGVLPTQLDGTSVTIDGKPAAVYYISPTQLNVQAPSDNNSGAVNVQVVNNGLTSASFSAQLQPVSPAFFLWNGVYAVATRTDFSLVGKPGLFSNATTVPAKPGDIIILWGTGFGATNPPVPSDQVVTGAPALVANPSVTVGGVTAPLISAVLSPGNAGLYQIAIQIPDSVPNGDLPVVALVQGIPSPGNVLLTVQK
jgi:uncharacterized protein (TIGR03437 family)